MRLIIGFVLGMLAGFAIASALANQGEGNPLASLLGHASDSE